MSRMNEQSQQQDERENLSGMSDCEQWQFEQEMEERFEKDFAEFVASHEEYYKAKQRDLPAHKRDGYTEKMYKLADDLRKRLREEGILKFMNSLEEWN